MSTGKEGLAKRNNRVETENRQKRQKSKLGCCISAEKESDEEGNKEANSVTIQEQSSGDIKLQTSNERKVKDTHIEPKDEEDGKAIDELTALQYKRDLPIMLSAAQSRQAAFISE